MTEPRSAARNEPGRRRSTGAGSWEGERERGIEIRSDKVPTLRDAVKISTFLAP
ncbi:MAG: hypothetical protein M3O88_02210 [Actinomycetota bacterium]|nr:hypothetical protein [Actinomycetota bacterium]